jgi:hypothetical protein
MTSRNEHIYRIDPCCDGEEETEKGSLFIILYSDRNTLKKKQIVVTSDILFSYASLKNKINDHQNF